MPVSKVRNGGAKWKERTQQAATAYVEGARNPRRSWSQATQASEEAYKQGVAEASAKGSFGKGVKAAGDQKYQRGIEEKGSQRFAQGVALSGDAYDVGFEPYRKVIESTNLPERKRKGDPANYDRVTVLGKALNAEKRKQRGLS